MKIIKKCELCGKNFESDTAVDFNICDDKHIYKCSNCGKDVYVTRNKEDFYKRKMISEQGIIFCDNKCSIQYNQKKKFMDRWKNIIPDIKRLYETTNMQVKDIMQKYNISQSTWKKIVERFGLVRPDNIKKSIYSNKSKKQVEKLKETEKFDEYREKQSNIMKEYWNNLNTKEKEKRTAKSFKNKTNEEQNKIIEKAFNTKMLKNSFGKSNEEDNLYMALVDEFGKDNVIRQYNLDGYVFDFKIIRPSTNPKKSGQMIEQLIELDGSYYHNYRPYINCEEHNNEYNEMIKTGGQKAKIAKKWKITDVDKYNYCKTHNLNYIAIYFDKRPEPYFTKQELVNSYNQIYKQKIGYRNISKHNEIIDNFCFKTLYKHNIQEFTKDSIYKYLVNRIKYVYNYGECCVRISMLKLVKDFNKCSNIFKSYTMHSSSNIQTFIKTYNIKSIGDPFAGWGQRMLGATSLNCDYFGCDINKEQINNLNNMYQFIKTNCNVTSNVTLYGQDSSTVDLSNTKYTAIFTCPPYWNSERYTNHGIENLSYKKFKEALQNIIRHWITDNVNIVGIQFNDKYEDCISELGYSYEKINISTTKHHFNKTNKKNTECIYILYIKRSEIK